MSIWFFIIPFTLAAALPGPAQGALIAQMLTRGGRSTLTFILGMVAGNSLWRWRRSQGFRRWHCASMPPSSSSNGWGSPICCS
ncbi:hypothetical protein [Rhizobium sp. IY2]|uniref:hypothetical protein n=1 Tax=Rhizobium sp. IY2 TaxID=3397853 RepID=UPI0039E0B950